jgi:hypothetical protein
MRVLVACEESQRVCIAFRERGHEAYSCDIIDCSGGHPEWHIKDDVLKHLNDGWDLMIAHPPCTYLCSRSQYWKKVGSHSQEDEDNAVKFFMSFVNASVSKICIENPVGIMSRLYKKPSQIIQPYYFGDTFMKKTCLWLKGLRPLAYIPKENLFNFPVTMVDKGEVWQDGSGKNRTWFDKIKGSKAECARIRSKTFPGIAKAMAEQWG